MKQQPTSPGMSDMDDDEETLQKHAFFFSLSFRCIMVEKLPNKNDYGKR